MPIEVQTTPVFTRLSEMQKPVKVLQGGTRSSKTFSVLQFIIFVYCNEHQGKRITVFRERLTWLKETVLKDFEEICATYQVPVSPAINTRRPDQTYHLNGNEIAFIGLDQTQKVFGRKQDLAWINEAIGDDYSYAISLPDFNQIENRTTEQIILDYNPKLTEHWIYDNLLKRPDVDFDKSTMLDNPFLQDKIRKKILSYKPTKENEKQGTADKHMWEVYGLGNKSRPEGQVFPNVFKCKQLPKNYAWRAYGLDFGFANSPTAMVEVRYSEGSIYMKELIYKKGLRVSDIVDEIYSLDIDLDYNIIADSEDARAIDELNDHFTVLSADKPAGSVLFGIQKMKQHKLYITDCSSNFWKEQENYHWDSRKGQLINKPVKKFDHLWDAARYCITDQFENNNEFFVV